MTGWHILQVFIALKEFTGGGSCHVATITYEASDYISYYTPLSVS